MNSESKTLKSTSGNGTFKKVVQCISLAVFLWVIFLPISFIVFGSPEEGALSYEQKYKLSSPDVSSYLDSSFQQNFEGWFSTHYSFRSNIVLAYNQLKYDIDNFGASNEISEPDPTQIDALSNDNPDAIDTYSQNPSEDGNEAASLTPVLIDSNPLYADINRLRIERYMYEPTGYKGTNTVYIGKAGYLYENGYINEYYGYSAIYRDCTYDDVKANVDKLVYIQQRLEEMGKTFIFVITPSKASQYPDAIPDWYTSMNIKPDGYVRPYDNLMDILKDSGLNYIDSTTLYEEVGLQETFPKTGIHWNKLASYETTVAILDMYEELSGETINKLASNGILSSTNPPGFGNPEQDIYGAVFSSISKSESIVDDLYYWHDAYAETVSGAKKIKVLIQGGSFAHDFTHYFSSFKIASRVTRCYYNAFPSDNLDAYKDNSKWEELLNSADLVLFEINEQFVRSMGGNAPYWAGDKTGYEIGQSIYDSLCEYLQNTEGQ